MGRIFLCSGCGKEKEYFARNLCGVCYQRQWREDNPEKARAIASRYYLGHLDYYCQYRKENQERIAKQARQYYREHSEEIKYRARRWELEHPERAKERKAQYYQDHRERMMEVDRQWAKENPEKMRVYQRRYRQKNKERIRVYVNQRRAAELAAEGYASVEQIAARIQYYGGLCYLCGNPYEAVDHVIPLSRGGSNWPANQRPICISCNSRKGTKLLQEARL